MWIFGFFCAFLGVILAIINIATGGSTALLVATWVCILIGVVGLFFADA